MIDFLKIIYDAGFSAFLHGFGAIDSWLNGKNKTGEAVHILTNASTADLAKLFENLRFPGISLADAALDDRDTTIYFCCRVCRFSAPEK